MSRYRMSDGMVVDTVNATGCWPLDVVDEWSQKVLYRSRRGRYYVEHTSQREGCRNGAEWVSNEEACRELLASGCGPEDGEDWPAELTELVEQVSE